MTHQKEKPTNDLLYFPLRNALLLPLRWNRFLYLWCLPSVKKTCGRLRVFQTIPSLSNHPNSQTATLFLTCRTSGACRMSVPEFIFNYEKSHPNHYVVASNHLFECNCMDCITFLYTTGDHLFDHEDPLYEKLQSSLVSNDQLSFTQISLLRELFNTYL